MVYWIHFQNIRTFTCQKTYFVLFCLVLKSSKTFSVSLSCVTTLQRAVHFEALGISDDKSGIKWNFSRSSRTGNGNEWRHVPSYLTEVHFRTPHWDFFCILQGQHYKTLEKRKRIKVLKYLVGKVRLRIKTCPLVLHRRHRRWSFQFLKNFKFCKIKENLYTWLNIYDTIYLVIGYSP